MKSRLWTISLVAALATGLFTLLAGCGKHDQAPPAASTAKTTRFHCPMHPTYTSDKPGDCPICNMKLVPIEEDKHAGHEMTGDAAAAPPGRMAVHVSSDRQQQIGLRTSPVEKHPLARAIRTVARVAYAEPRLAWVNTKVMGWIEKLHVAATGQYVKKGQPLLELYSPELVSAQEEYLIALQARDKLKGSVSREAAEGGESLLAAARKRLQLWDITDEQIAQLEKSGEAKKTLTIVSPFDGFVVEKSALAGKSVMAGENLYRIADLSSVWLYADIYENELPFVKEGQEATVTLSYLPGETFAAKISYLYPYLDEQTRTVKVRLEAPNPGHKLKPDMWANVELRVEPAEALAIPASAAIHTGTRYVAFVDKGEGRFEPRELKIGVKTDEYVEVKEGLSEGEKVVTRALFLIDSESQLRAAISGMSGEHQH